MDRLVLKGMRVLGAMESECGLEGNIKCAEDCLCWKAELLSVPLEFVQRQQSQTGTLTVVQEIL